MRNRECVKKVAERKGYSYKEFPNYVQHSSKKIFWLFYDNGSWISIRLGNENQVLAKVTGKWECDESNNYKVVMAENFYLSKTNKWLPNPEQTTEPEQNPEPSAGSTTQPPATPATEEPTYDKSKFPLKLGIRGPEVAQLQNYLNKLIPFEPLVVDGIFGKKTQDKLIQLQNKLIQLQKYTSI